MGCCVSSGTADRTNENVSDKNTTIGEEETVVKEVLSETAFHTTSSSVQNSVMDDPVKRKIRGREEEKLKVAPDSCMTRPDSNDPEEGSEVSEICSLSLSESVSSTAVMNGYGEEEVKQRKSQRSPAKTRTRVTGNNYPTRRTDQSPHKRNNGVCNSNTGARVGSGMRDPGERSGRRSRSPATNRSVMDSDQSRVGGARTRKNGQSPGRVRFDPNKNTSDQQPYQNHGYTTEDKTGTSSDGAGTKTTSKFSGKLNRKKTKTFPSESASSNEKCTPETSDSENGVQQDTNPEKVSSTSKVKASGRRGGRKRNNNRVAERVSRRTQKRQKKSEASDTDSIATGSRSASDAKHKDNEDATSSSQKHVKSGSSKNSRKNDTPVDDSKNSVKGDDPVSQLNAVASEPCSDGSLRKEEFVGENVCPGGLSEDKSWRPLEKSLFQKGVEIFGMNSCMIARNLLCGLKSCWEVFQYMTCSENKASFFGGDALNPDGSSKFDINGNMTNNQVRRRSRFLRRRGKVRRLKYTWKSAAYHSIRKRSTDKKDQPCRQFNPCNCKTACGKECTCLLNGTCCEKYCGCPKSCKNRFRGCHCAKSQCRSRQCPCFAADRECDPDVCRNCWVIGGDGTLGVPSQRGDNYECRNMKLLLKQQQRVLLGISDVSGWGAFLKNSVSKHEYLGEYTGELISHKEADKRGKIYDRENSSFLFNLNDQFVLDAYRKGDKLKFANHSPEPNCYAKVIMVAGDHRVGIFAKERILAGEELFYDYRYEPDRAPAWARKPEASGSKKDENVTPSVGRPKKVA